MLPAIFDIISEKTDHIVEMSTEDIKTAYKLRSWRGTLDPQLKPEEFSSEPVSYSSSDEKTVSVSDKGSITAVAAGTAVITIYSGGSSITTEVTVADPIVYIPPTYTNTSASIMKTSSSKKSTSKKTTSKKSSDKKKSSSSGTVKGYFDSSDDEHF